MWLAKMKTHLPGARLINSNESDNSAMLTELNVA
jgi:hypothetical protein